MSSSVSVITSSIAGSIASTIASTTVPPTTATASATTVGPPSASATGNGGNSGGPSSPLLFFVALGFGVVFTNLWIIVGVKYCFRYNQRNRQRMNGEDPDAVDLGAMPRTHRRRREKKLMTMDEVNEKFPLTKYKTWRASRADEGLPTAGGINTASKPASLHNVTLDSKEEDKETAPRAHSSTAESTAESQAAKSENTQSVVDDEKNASSARPETPADKRPKSTQSTLPPGSPIKKVTSAEDDDDDDEHIQTAVPAEQLPDPGDACAICIDTIEDDDDIRGLQCGHAFHASCVDPWLTSRRACCPLCKADYYVPKPRPDGTDELGRRQTNPDLEPPPPTGFSIIGSIHANRGRGGRPAMIIPGRFMSVVYHDRDRHGFPIVMRTGRNQPTGQQSQARPAGANAPPTSDANGVAPQNQQSTWRSRLAALRLPGRSAHSGRGQNDGAATRSTPPTPSQLESGRS